MKHPALLALIIILSTAPAAASGSWDFFGGAGLNVGRADNPRFAGRTVSNPKFDPTALICLGPNDPAHDPNIYSPGDVICQETIRVPAVERRSDYTGSVRLTGGLQGTWSSTSFDLAYSPVMSFFYDRSELNQTSHNVSSNWKHAHSPRSTTSLNAMFGYTPEQDVDPNDLARNNVLVSRTNRVFGTFRGSYTYQATPLTSFDWSYHYLLRAFVADDFVDSSDHNVSMNWRRRLGPRAFIQSGYVYGLTLYSDGPFDPNVVAPRAFDSSHHRASAGWGIQTPRGLTVGLDAGYNVVEPEDSRLERHSGFFGSASCGWNGTRLSATGGYAHALTDGGGAFANAQSDVLHASLRLKITQSLSGDLALSHNVHERLAQGTGIQETVRTDNARATLNYAFARNWAANASWTHYKQDGAGAGNAVPDIRSNRYSLGISWSVR